MVKSASSKEHDSFLLYKQQTNSYSLAHLKSDININQLSKAKQKPSANLSRTGSISINTYTYRFGLSLLTSFPPHYPLPLFLISLSPRLYLFASFTLSIGVHFIRLQYERLQMIMASKMKFKNFHNAHRFAFNLKIRKCCKHFT